jgi:hypothetical protein
VRSIATLGYGGGDATVLDALNVDDRDRGLATAASAFAGAASPTRALDAYDHALSPPRRDCATLAGIARARGRREQPRRAPEERTGRTEPPDRGMVDAARAALAYWKRAGGWIEEERAEYRLSCSLLCNAGARARRRAARAASPCRPNDARRSSASSCGGACARTARRPASRRFERSRDDAARTSTACRDETSATRAPRSLRGARPPDVPRVALSRRAADRARAPMPASQLPRAQRSPLSNAGAWARCLAPCSSREPLRGRELAALAGRHAASVQRHLLRCTRPPAPDAPRTRADVALRRSRPTTRKKLRPRTRRAIRRRAGAEKNSRFTKEVRPTRWLRYRPAVVASSSAAGAGPGARVKSLWL